MWQGVLGGVKVRMGVGRPCPPVRNDIVTPRHLLNYQIILIQFCLALYKAFLQNLFEHNFNIKISLTIFYCTEKNQTNKHPQTIEKKICQFVDLIQLVN